MTANPSASCRLPANPNCVSFAISAQDLLGHRSWADVQHLARNAAKPFHEASGLPVLVGLGWRVALDRRNQRHLQALTYFVFDGPATSAHLDQLDDSMHQAAAGFGAGSIERVPTNGVPAVLLCDGRATLPVDRAVDGSQWFRRLVLEGGRIRPMRQAVDAADPEDLDPALEPQVAIRAPLTAEDQETERMRLAFALHFSQEIVEADGVVHDEERAFLADVFPRDLVVRLGLGDEDTQREYLDAALERLSGRLGHHDKLGLVGLFFSACYADGSLDVREMRVLKVAGEHLGLRREEVVKYLRRFW